MAYFENVRAVTLPIGGAIAQYRFVTVDSSGNAVVATNGAAAVGVTMEGVSASQYDSGNGQTTVNVAIIAGGGKFAAEMTASTALTVGANVAADANGTMIPAATGDTILGVALQAAGSGADQEIVTFLAHSPGVTA